MNRSTAAEGSSCSFKSLPQQPQHPAVWVKSVLAPDMPCGDKGETKRCWAIRKKPADHHMLLCGCLKNCYRIFFMSWLLQSWACRRWALTGWTQQGVKELCSLPRGHPTGGGCGGLLSSSLLQAGLPTRLGPIQERVENSQEGDVGRLFLRRFLISSGVDLIAAWSSASCPFPVHSRESLALCSPDPTSAWHHGVVHNSSFVSTKPDI